MQILVVIRYDETEIFADSLISLGVTVDKMYLSAKLKDMNSITWDELRFKYDAIIVDSHLTEVLVRFSGLNHSKYYFLYLEGKDVTDSVLLKADYLPIRVTGYENKTRDDWTKAAIFFLQGFAKSANSESNI